MPEGWILTNRRGSGSMLKQKEVCWMKVKKGVMCSSIVHSQLLGDLTATRASRAANLTRLIKADRISLVARFLNFVIFFYSSCGGLSTRYNIQSATKR